jgi:hypothetical protein
MEEHHYHVKVVLLEKIEPKPDPDFSSYNNLQNITMYRKCLCQRNMLKNTSEMQPANIDCGKLPNWSESFKEEEN